MKVLTEEELGDALVDVRRAYRLLHDYQRRVLDAVQCICTSTNLEFKKTSPHFGCLAKEGSKPTDSAWDWLGMYLCEFWFQPKPKVKDNFWFSLVLVSDSGCYLDDKDAHRSKTNGFADEEKESQSFIFFSAGDYDDGPNILEMIKKTKKKKSGVVHANGKKHVAKKYPLSQCLLNEGKIRDMLKDFNRELENREFPQYARIKLTELG